jgi:hypothetical protein
MSEPTTPKSAKPRRTKRARATAAAAVSGGAQRPLDDPRVLQILSTEHWSLLSTRSLAYNEAFTRAGMFLTFLSMSFVALALLAQAMSFGRDYLVIAAIVLAFAFIIGLATYVRIVTTWIVDAHATQGMNRIRHGYVDVAPVVENYFITSIHDDAAGVMRTYDPRTVPGSVVQDLAYGLSTTLGMIAIIVSLVGGALASVVAMAFGVSTWVAVGIGAVVAIASFAMGARWGFGALQGPDVPLPARFPTPANGRGHRTRPLG